MMADPYSGYKSTTSPWKYSFIKHTFILVLMKK